jgi:hypothetical protein
VWKRRVEVHSLGAIQVGYKRAGYLDCCGCWETYEILRDDWFGNPSTLWNHPCGFIALAQG